MSALKRTYGAGPPVNRAANRRIGVKSHTNPDYKKAVGLAEMLQPPDMAYNPPCCGGLFNIFSAEYRMEDYHEFQSRSIEIQRQAD
jgi:hypothetical protein